MAVLTHIVCSFELCCYRYMTQNFDSFYLEVMGFTHSN